MGKMVILMIIQLYFYTGKLKGILLYQGFPTPILPTKHQEPSEVNSCQGNPVKQIF